MAESQAAAGSAVQGGAGLFPSPGPREAWLAKCWDSGHRPAIKLSGWLDRKQLESA